MNFCTIFPNFGREHLYKDVGMIPITLSQKYYDNCSILCSGGNNVEDSRVAFIQCKKICGSKTLGIIMKLFGIASEIDVLNIYHLDLCNFFFIQIFHMLNRRGVVYLKLDMDYENYKHLKNNVWIKKYIKKKIIFGAEVVSVESTPIQKLLEEMMEPKKILYVPNGIDKLESDIKLPKENIILTVGRLGTKQKATEILVEAFLKSQYHEQWKLYLVGKRETDFDDYLDAVKRGNPELSKNIILTDEIKCREDLYTLYSKASIFVLPSRWESFGIVLAEAQIMGSYVITTDKVPAAVDMISDESDGMIIKSDDSDELAGCLDHVIEKRLFLNNTSTKTALHDRFDWMKICDGLRREIEEQRSMKWTKK